MLPCLNEAGGKAEAWGNSKQPGARTVFANAMREERETEKFGPTSWKQNPTEALSSATVKTKF
jgi:hypothetical protein